MHYFKQLWREIRALPLVGAVTVIGTALSLFLIMVVMMLQEVQVAPIAPESNRPRFLYVGRMVYVPVDGGMSSMETSYDYHTINELFNGLEHTEAFAVFSHYPYKQTVSEKDGGQVFADFRNVNADFWKVFDFTFLNGRPFTVEEVLGEAPVAVITEDIARQTYGTSDVVGREIYLNGITPYKVVGVVRDVPTVTDCAYAQVWLPIKDDGVENTEDILNWGSFTGVLLADREGRRDEVRQEINRRREILNTRLRPLKVELRDLDVPYLVDEYREAQWQGFRESMEQEKHERYYIYLLLLLIPAINLSNITQSRLRRRFREIGIRRAFGCTRARLVSDILTENFILTLVGGVVGVVAGLLFLWLASDILWKDPNNAGSAAYMSLLSLIDGSVLLCSLGGCFLLNILSAGVPAIKAALMNPVEAIGGINK